MRSWCCAEDWKHSLPCRSFLRATTFANLVFPWVIWLTRLYCEKICCLATALPWCNWLFWASKNMFYSLIVFLCLFVWVYTPFLYQMPLLVVNISLCFCHCSLLIYVHIQSQIKKSHDRAGHFPLCGEQQPWLRTILGYIKDVLSI